MFSEIDLEAAAQRLASTTKRFTFLVGSGLSRSASIKTGPEVADQLVCDWAKAETLEWTDSNSLKEAFCSSFGVPDFSYTTAMERILPSRAARQQYIENLCADKEPLAHRELAALAAAEGSRFTTILTPNFDPLIEYALFDIMPRPPAIYYRAIDVPSCIPHSPPQLVKLHGDYIYLDLANIGEEFEHFKDDIQRVIHCALHGRGLLVLGIGGRERHLTEGIEKASKEPGALDGGMFWFASTSYDNPDKLPADLFTKLCAEGKEVYVVWVDGKYPVDVSLCKLRETLAIGPTPPPTGAKAELLKRIHRRVPRGASPITQAKPYPPPGGVIVPRRLTEILEQSRKPVLVLGEPGAGKSMGLLWEAYQTIERGGDVAYMSIEKNEKDPRWPEHADLLCLDQLEVVDEPGKLLGPARVVVGDRGRLFIASRDKIFSMLPRDHGLQIFRIEPLSPETVEELVRQELPDRLVGDFLNALRNLEARVGTMTKTPLWLMMSCTIYPRRRRLPESRVELYDEYVRWFLGPWSRQRTSCRKDTLQKIAEDAAFHLEDPRGSARPGDELLGELAATGMITEIRRLEFLHTTFQEYFAARKSIRAIRDAAATLSNTDDWTAARNELGKGLPKDILRSEVNEWVAELLTERPAEREAFVRVLRQLGNEIPPTDKFEANLWYMASLVTEGIEEIRELIPPRVAALCKAEALQTPMSEATLLNANMAGIYLGLKGCLGGFLKTLERDRFEASWTLCPFRDMEMPFWHTGSKDWNTDRCLQVLSEGGAEVREVLMHTGHRAVYERLERIDEFRLAVETRLHEAMRTGEDSLVPMNAIIALRRIGGQRSVEVILDVSNQGDWRVLRSAMDAIARVKPTDMDRQTLDRVKRFLEEAPNCWTGWPPYQVAITWLLWALACKRLRATVSVVQPIENLPEPYRTRLMTAARWF